METFASLAKSTAHAGRWCVNAALMAVGIQPLETPLIESALLPGDGVNALPGAAPDFGRRVNPATGLRMLTSAVDVGGHPYGGS